MEVQGYVRWLLAGAVLLGGCPSFELAPLEPCTISGVGIEVPQTTTKLDVLFVVDDSGSMSQEQRALATELPRMVQILASGDLDEDGVADFPAVDDMHLGIVSTDLGAAGQDVDDSRGCGLPGADAQLVFPSHCSGPREGNYLAFRTGDDPLTLGSAFACLTELGTRGCGLEQQLDAMLKALTPPTSPTRFFGGSLGHGGPAGAGTPNAGFLRDEAVLAVIVVTDEDDCSVPDAQSELMAFDGGAYASEPLNLRCGLHPESLHPIERYRDGLLALKPLNPELVIFAAITGIPTRLEGQDAATILADPDMQFRADRPPTHPLYARAEPEPSCEFPNPDYDPSDEDSEEMQDASPPRRIVETAAAFGENGVVRSLCQQSFTGALDAIIAKISDRLPEPCLPQPLVRNAQGVVECDVVELIPDDGRGEALCDASRGRTPLETRPFEDPQTQVTTRMQVCAIDQVPVVDQTLQPSPRSAQVVGWYYDDFSPETMRQCGAQPQQVRFTPDAEPLGESVVSLECGRLVSGANDASQGRAAVGLSCEGNGLVCAERNCGAEQVHADSRECDKAYALACESRSNTCQIACDSDAQCPRGWTCQHDATGMGLCVLPTCSAISIDSEPATAAPQGGL